MTTNDVTTNDILALLLAHKWIAVTSLAIGLAVRVTKEDTVVPIDVPARWRPMLALILGQISAVLEHLAVGTPWKTAIVNGVIASVVAILGHEWIVERFLGDGEVPVPGLTKKSPTPKSRWDEVDPDAPTPNVDVPVVDVPIVDAADDPTKKN